MLSTRVTLGSAAWSTNATTASIPLGSRIWPSALVTTMSGIGSASPRR